MIRNRTTPSARLITLFMLLLMTGVPAISQDTDLMAAKQFAEAFFKAREQVISSSSDQQIAQTGDQQVDSANDAQVSPTADGPDAPTKDVQVLLEKEAERAQAKGAVVASELILTYQSPGEVQTPLFVFQQEDGGYAMVAKGAMQFTIVGYSDDAVFQPEHIPPQLQVLMDYYEDSLVLKDPAAESKGAGTPVVPALLKEKGIQLNQYSHPEAGGSVTGCMATAITQILLFHAAERNTPVKGFDTHCYTHPEYGELCADFENADYSSAELLSYHVAIALDMRFAAGGSSPPPGIDVIGRFEKHFQYFVDNCNSENFYLKNELDHRRPVYASLTGWPENHAVVIDGYDDQDFFHLNFGWGGHFNGYFMINNNTWFGTGNAGEKYHTNPPRTFLFSPEALPVNTQDSLALVSLHNALGGQAATGWDLSKSVWKWPGVLVMNDRVIRLAAVPDIPPASATSIPPEIGNLTALQKLHLGGCLNGTVPSTITQLVNLKELNIGNSYVYEEPTLYTGNLNWVLPDDIDQLAQLEWLSVYNTLEGPLPSSLGNLSDLRLLFLHQDTVYFGRGGITGQLPPELGNLNNLQQLHISNQQLEGEIPPGIGQLPELREMDLSGNLLSGPLPVLSLPHAGYIRLHDNLFSSFAEGSGSCPELKLLQLQDNQLTGDFSSWAGDYTQLEFLNISNNKIAALPGDIGNWTRLRSLKADHNQLQELPDGLALLLHLEHLSASNNQVGYVPANLGHSRSLKTVDLSRNLLTSAPPSLGNCPDLYELFLNSNKIDSIPANYAHIPDRAVVLLQDNELKGAIPEKLMIAVPDNGKFVRLDSNRFVFNDIPASEQLGFGVRSQKNVPLQKQVHLVQPGDEVSIDIRSISNLSHPGNEYYWLPYPELLNARVKDERFSGMENNLVLQLKIDEKNVHKRYYCKVFNPTSPSFTFTYEGSPVTSPCMEYVHTDTLVFQLATDEEILAEKYSEGYVTSLQAVPGNTISDGKVSLVPPLTIKRGVVEWEASADGADWEQVSESMAHADLKANIVSVTGEALVLKPVNTAFYRCRLDEAGCAPLYSAALEVKAPGEILFDATINVTEAPRTIAVDSIEIVVPQHFYDDDFRLTIVKLAHPPAFPSPVVAGTAYDVSVSFGDTFEIPLLIKLKNTDKSKVTETGIDRFKAVYFNEKHREWKPFEHAHISLKDSSIAFTTNHLTKLSWWWDEEAAWGYTDVYERNNIRVFFKEGDTDFMKFGYAKKQSGQPWHVAGIPLLVQDITEFLPVVMMKYKSLGLQVPDGGFSVFVKQMDDAGCVGLLGMLNGYMLIDANISDPVELRQVLAHEYMHYTQDYYISANPGNSFWMEAHATLADRMVWNETEVPLCESEALLLDGRTAKHSVFQFLSQSWDYWDKSVATNNLLGNIHYNYLAGTFLHYMRSEREEGAKLEPATLLRETSWFGSWRTYLGSYVNNHLDALLGDEYEEFVKYILSGKNENFTLINKNGNPFAYLQDPRNNKVFTHPVTYRFREGEEMVQKDEMDIRVPYMAAKIVLLENTNPDTMVLVNYKRKHDADYDHLVYHVRYDFEEKKMSFTDISDKEEYNLLLEEGNKENMLTRFQQYSFLLLINKEYIGASGLIDDFNASFELTAMPVLDIDRVGLLNIYNGSSPIQHTFDNKQDYIFFGSPGPAFLQQATEFEVRMVDRSVTKRITDGQSYEIQSRFTLVMDQGLIKGMPTMKDSTIYHQTIVHDVINGTLKVTEHEHKYHMQHTFITYVVGEDGDMEEKVVYDAYFDLIEERTKTMWLVDFMTFMQPPAAAAGWEGAYGEHPMLFETPNTTGTCQVVTKIDATISTQNFNTSGEWSSGSTSVYQSTDYSSPNLVWRLILLPAEKE